LSRSLRRLKLRVVGLPSPRASRVVLFDFWSWSSFSPSVRPVPSWSRRAVLFFFGRSPLLSPPASFFLEVVWRRRERGEERGGERVKTTTRKRKKKQCVVFFFFFLACFCNLFVKSTNL
jgi:hypothetical protein